MCVSCHFISQNCCCLFGLWMDGASTPMSFPPASVSCVSVTNAPNEAHERKEPSPTDWHCHGNATQRLPHAAQLIGGVKGSRGPGAHASVARGWYSGGVPAACVRERASSGSGFKAPHPPPPRVIIPSSVPSTPPFALLPFPTRTHARTHTPAGGRHPGARSRWGAPGRRGRIVGDSFERHSHGGQGKNRSADEP